MSDIVADNAIAPFRRLTLSHTFGSCRLTCQAPTNRLERCPRNTHRALAEGKMMTDETRVSVRLPRRLAEALDRAAEAQSVNTSIILRAALETYLGTLAGAGDAERRRQFSSEYLFLVADLIAQREYPDVHNELLIEAERRMEALHGAA
jgi:hypothetical protein